MDLKSVNIGDICIKTFGKETGKKCIVIEIMDKNFVLITGPKEITGVKRRRSSVKHILSTGEKVKINANLSDKELIDVLNKSNKFEYMKTSNTEHK